MLGLWRRPRVLDLVCQSSTQRYRSAVKGEPWPGHGRRCVRTNGVAQRSIEGQHRAGLIYTVCKKLGWLAAHAARHTFHSMNAESDGDRKWVWCSPTGNSNQLDESAI